MLVYLEKRRTPTVSAPLGPAKGLAASSLQYDKILIVS